MHSHDPDARLLHWWAQRRDRFLSAAIALMIVAAAVWLAYEFWRLLFQAPPMGAIDLRHRYNAQLGWFRGELVYTRPTVLDPPATHLLLWPLLVCVDFSAARLLWAVLSAAALAWTSMLTVRWSGAESARERTLAALLPLSTYPFGATIGNGQLGVFVLPLLIAAAVRLRSTGVAWGRDLLVAALLLGALVKPNLSAPFCWVVLFASRSLRPAWIAGAAYVALTLVSASFQPADLPTILLQSLANASEVGTKAVPGNVANLHVWLGSLGLEELAFPASLLVMIALGVWVWRNRDADLWILLGATGYTALFATYHRWYDELLLLLPIVALFRIAKSSADPATAANAGVLLVFMVASTLAPGGLFLFPPPLNLLYVAGQVLIWATGLVFLLRHASAAPRRSAARPAATRPCAGGARPRRSATPTPAPARSRQSRSRR